MLCSLSSAPLEAFSKFPMPRNTQVFAPTFSGEGIVRWDDVTHNERYGHNSPRKGMPGGLPACPCGTGKSRFFGHAKTAMFSERSENGLAELAAEAAVAIPQKPESAGRFLMLLLRDSAWPRR
jgi:hypothetical protein